MPCEGPRSGALGPTFGMEVHVDAADLSVAELQEAEPGSPGCAVTDAPDAARDPIGDDVGVALRERTGLRGAGLGAVAEGVHPGERRPQRAPVHLDPAVLGQAGLDEDVGYLVHRNADEQVVRLVVVLEVCDPCAGVDPVDPVSLRVRDPAFRHRLLERRADATGRDRDRRRLRGDHVEFAGVAESAGDESVVEEQHPLVRRGRALERDREDGEQHPAPAESSPTRREAARHRRPSNTRSLPSTNPGVAARS